MRKAARLAALAAGVTALLAAPTALAQTAPTYGQNDAGGFRNVLPAGEAGVDNALQLAQTQANGAIPPHFNDQLPLYANLVYADPTLTPAQISTYYKDATYGIQPQNVQSQEQPDPTGEPGLVIYRDQYDVPHIYGSTRAEVEFGTGWAAAEDRLFLIDVLRHVARAQLSSFVGGSPSNRAMDESQWGVAPYTAQDLQSQLSAATTLYGAAGAWVAHRIRRDSLRDDPDHDLDLHALLSIVMCWPHDVQSLFPLNAGGPGSDLA